VTDWNTRLIDEFRANDGQVDGYFEGAPLLLLHHVGARTGTARISPLRYEPVDGGYAIFASKGGAPTNPDWYHNLIANPETSVEIGSQTVSVTARLANDAERVPIWDMAKANFAPFVEYEAKTDRTIPVFLLEPKP
jgi:deazaflavin-dependent oxidoreductase (nitroreductase family)